MRAPGFPPDSYPSRETRIAFVEAYVRARSGDALLGDPPGGAELPANQTALLYAADACSLASHLQWSAWCVVQAALSTGIEYDFEGCARNLLTCHDARVAMAFPRPM